MNIFVTGTDTGVGKTFFSTLLVRALRASGVDAVGFKPITCGSWDDVDALVEAGDGVEPRDAVGPMKFDTPASPLTAARADHIEIDPDALISAYRAISERHELVVVEGVGGWTVPITPRYSMADLAVAFGAPVIVIAQNRLGAINHTLLTVENISHRGLSCGGIVLNHVIPPDDPAMRSNRETLELLAPAPLLGELSPGQRDLDLASFRFVLSLGKRRTRT